MAISLEALQTALSHRKRPGLRGIVGPDFSIGPEKVERRVDPARVFNVAMGKAHELGFRTPLSMASLGVWGGPVDENGMGGLDIFMVPREELERVFHDRSWLDAVFGTRPLNRRRRRFVEDWEDTGSIPMAAATLQDALVHERQAVLTEMRDDLRRHIRRRR